ncbi:hypothetical protein [Pseudomonas fluorescens]|uniref:Uncharacterized protein n=1 Tax=Pseudomonas fluorescens TaxID=294 RepID=A0A5E6ZVX1_PSEFL|nr:hypothetical protein [Pseudomonas fluorescens]VVN70536.1 hypothetical protein PS710_00394 [Pseudomonas fluorescens]
MLIALVVLNALYLICSLLFNAELLNMAGADIPLKKLEVLELYSQLLAATSMCLLLWRICYHRYQGKGRVLWISLAVSTAVVTPLSWWFQGAAPDWIAEQFPASLRVSSLYAYVTKKGLLYDSLTIANLPYKEYKDQGEGKAFIANLGVLMSVQSSYVERIDKNFQGFSAAVFQGFTKRNSEALYERLQETVVPSIADITRAYAKLEGFRAAGIPDNDWTPIKWPNAGEDLGYVPTADEYARSISPGVRTREAIANTVEVRYMAKAALGPLYVKGMNLLATREQFQSYLPGIASNMAFDVAHTDIHGPEGLNVLKNMLFIPFSLLSGLFFSAISLVVLIISGIEALRQVQGRNHLVRAVAIFLIVIVPIVIGNKIVDSAGYSDAFSGSGKQPILLANVFSWAMASEAMLYNITKPLLKAE